MEENKTLSREEINENLKNLLNEEDFSVIIKEVPNIKAAYDEAHRLVYKQQEEAFDKAQEEAKANATEENPFEATNDSTFILRLRKPFNPIMGIISMQYCGIVPKEVVEKWGKDYRSHPCGTGAFVMTHWEEGVTITYQKNKNYWERDTQGNQLPYLDGIKATFIDSKATEFLMFMQGDLDFMNGIDASFKDQVLSKKGELKNEFT